MTRLLVSLLLLQAALPAFAALTPPEQTVIKDCADNVDLAKKLLSPEAADKCVKGLNAGSPTLLNKYQQEDPSAATRILSYNNSLLDLKEIVVRQGGADGALALYRVLEKDNCALCDLKLGPRPELAFEWVGKYASDRDGAFKTSVRTWDALGDVRTKSLSAAPYGKNKAGWNGQEILDRYYELGDWATKETDKLAAASKAAGAAGKLDLSSLSGVLRSDLQSAAFLASRQGVSYDSYLAAIKKLDEITKAAAAPAAPAKPSAADGKSKDLAAAGAKFDPAGANTEGNLNSAFDGTGNFRPGVEPALKPVPAGTGTGTASGTKPTPIKPVQMTAAEEKALGEAMMRMEKGKPAGYLADVMNETEAGKRTNAFYTDPKYAKTGGNKLAFGFTRSPGAFGYWDPDAKVIRMNSEMAEEFAANRGMTVPQMMKDKAAMTDFALYMSPVMVHESEHQNQTARAIAGGYDYQKFAKGSSDPYTRAKENLSNKQGVEHEIEYCSKHGGAACFQKFSEMHADNAQKYMRGGVEALDALKAPLYPRIDSMEGGTAREFKSAQAYATYLKTLEDKNRTSPKSMTAKELQDMNDYRAMMDTRFKWYTEMYREAQDAESTAVAFRKKYGTTELGLGVPAL